MSIVEIHHLEGPDPVTTRLRAVLRDRELASFDLRWGDRLPRSDPRRPRRVEIHRLAVDPGIRDRGVLGRLFDRLAALARERGIRHVDVTVHHGAVDLCTAIGFRTTGDALWQGTRRVVPMSLDLTNWSSIRGRPEVATAITRLSHAGVVHAPVTRTVAPSGPVTATA